MLSKEAIPNDSNIKKNEQEKLKKCQGLREELKMWKVKATVVQVVFGALGAVEDLSRASGSSRNRKDTAQDPQAPRPLVRGPELEG